MVTARTRLARVLAVLSRYVDAMPEAHKAMGAARQAIKELGDDAYMVDLFDRAMEIYVDGHDVDDIVYSRMSEAVDDALTHLLRNRQ